MCLIVNEINIFSFRFQPVKFEKKNIVNFSIEKFNRIK